MTSSDRFARVIASAAKGAARLGPAAVPPASTPEIESTVIDVCQAAYQRGGWRALLTRGVAEAVDVLRCAIGARLGVPIRLTTGTSTPAAAPRRRRPPMFTTDLRRAWRRLRARPSVALGAATMLALGIGLTTSMFSLADSLFLRPAPFRDPATLAQIEMTGNHTGHATVSPHVLHAWQSSGLFDTVQAASPGTALVDTPAGLVSRSRALVTPGVFDMLAVRPLRGRLFTRDEGRAGNDAVVVISESIWRGAYGGAPDILGRAISIDGASATVVGVMPATFHFPQWDTVIWMPIDFSAPGPTHAHEDPWPDVRFSARMPRADALAAATRMAHDVDPSTATLKAADLSLAAFQVDPYYQHAIPMLSAGVALVFLVLCANASSLILAAFTSRKREFGLCAALGASRARVLREAVVEASLIGAAGALAGLALASGVIALARRFLPDAFLVRTLNPLDLNGRAVLAAVAAGSIAVLIAGVLPAWMATRGGLSLSLRDVDRGGTSSRHARRLMRGLIAAEVALACMLLVGSTLLVRSFLRLVNTDRGIDVTHVLTTWTSLPAARYPNARALGAATQTVRDGVAALPGVEGTALSRGVPPSGGSTHFYKDWRSDAPGAPSLDLVVHSFSVSPGFFELYEIPIILGRDFTPSDTAETAIVSEHLAAALWPKGDPIGHSFSFGNQRLQVVGVAREITLPSPDVRQETPEFYVPLTTGTSNPMISIRCRGACPDAAVIRREIMRDAPGATVYRVEPAETPFIAQIAPPRAAASLSLIFAVVAFLAAAGGLFSVLTYAVGKRQREFGIRAALGASPPQIRAVVLRDGLTLAAVGLVFGAGLSWLLGRALTSLEYGASIADAATWAPPFLLIAIASLAAVWRPARRAMRVDPALLLRGE